MSHLNISLGTIMPYQSDAMKGIQIANENGPSKPDHQVTDCSVGSQQSHRYGCAFNLTCFRLGVSIL